MDNTTIIQLFAKQDEHMEKLMAAQATVISARVDLKIEEKMNVFGKKIDNIIVHNEKQNGWLKSHTELIENSADDISELQVDIDCHNRNLRNLKKYSIPILLVCLGVFIGVIWLYDHVDARKTFENKTGIELIDETYLPKK